MDVETNSNKIKDYLFVGYSPFRKCIEPKLRRTNMPLSCTSRSTVSLDEEECERMDVFCNDLLQRFWATSTESCGYYTISPADAPHGAGRKKPASPLTLQGHTKLRCCTQQAKMGSQASMLSLASLMRPFSGFV